MKNLLCLLPLLIVLSCSKEAAEKPPKVQSVTYLRQHYDINNKLSFVDTSIHWCRVSGEDLARFERETQTRYYICGTDPQIWGVLVIDKPCSIYPHKRIE